MITLISYLLAKYRPDREPAMPMLGIDPERPERLLLIDALVGRPRMPPA